MTQSSDVSRFLRRAADAVKDLAIERGAAPEARRPRYGPLYQAAAVVSTFDLDKLVEGQQENVEKAELYALTGDCRPIKLPEGGVRWTLASDVRRRVLRQLGDPESILRVLERVGKRPDDLVQKTFENYLKGQAPSLENQKLGQLTASYRVLQWLGESVRSAPTTEDVKLRIALATLLQPFQDLIGENFQGRDTELDELSDYVGARRASSGTEWIWRGLREVFNFHEKPPFMTYGPGGMGKSTFLAKFILDHAVGEGAHKVPFVYVDFDRPAMSAEEPLTLLFEALRQLAVQFPHARQSLLGLRSSWERKFVEEIRGARGTRGNSTSSAVRRGSVPRVSEDMRSRMLREFASTLRVLKQDDKPLILLLDTIEEVQFRGRPVVEELWSFLESLQELHPRLRVVLSGRVPISEGFGETEEEQKAAERRFRTKLLPLAGLDRQAAERYMEKEGLPGRNAELIARHIAHKKDGISPLIMRVAVGVWRKRQEEAEKSGEPLDEKFWAELKAGRIQTQLISRYLDHVHTKELQRLAYPGFVLRRVTPELVLKVLGGPCGVEVRDLDHAGELLDGLSEEIALVKSIYGGERELRPRAEVRRLVLDLMHDLDPDKVEKIHLAAVRYYQAKSDEAEPQSESWIEARAEEIYHRVALKQDEDRIRERWDPVLKGPLIGALPELDDEQQALLHGLTGKAVPRSLRQRLSQKAWELDAERRAQDHLNLGRDEEALAVFAERGDRLPGSPLYNLEGRILVRLGRWDEVRELMAKCLASFEAGSSSAARVEALCIAAEADAQLEGGRAAALEKLKEAAALAETREDAIQRLGVAVLWLETLRRGPAEEEELHRAEEAAARRVQAAPDRELEEHAGLVFRAAELLGSGHPDVLVRAIRLGALYGLTERNARKLGRALGRLDAEFSEAAGEEPGWVATRAGLRIDRSATEAWKELLSKTPTLAADVLLQVFEEFPPPPEHEIWRQISEIIGRSDESAESNLPNASAKGQARGRSAGLLSDEQLARLHKALLGAFEIRELSALLDFRLGRSLESLSLKNDSASVASDVIQAARAEGWLEDLILAAREARPADSELHRLASELGLGTVQVDDGTNLERLVQDSGLFADLNAWRSRLAAIEGRICRVEVKIDPGLILGTGFLVSPELLLTAYHVLEPVVEGQAPPEDASFRFDYKESPGGRSLHPGTVFHLAPKDWLVDGLPGDPRPDQAPDEDRLDFVLVRLDGYPGDEPVGGLASGPWSTRRGWIEMPPAPPELGPGQPISIVHYPEGRPLRISFDTEGVARVAENRSRLWYRAPTLPGSGGAPVFNLAFELVAIHEGGSTELNLNFGVPIARILEHLAKKGHLQGIGADLA